MMPQFHLHFGPTSFESAWQLSLPLIPGGIFIGGLLVAYPNLALSVRETLGFGEYASLIVLVFVTYVFGSILFVASSILTGIVSGITQGLVFRSWTPTRWSWLLSQSTIWRNVAARFLGTGLTPVIQESQPPATAMEKLLAGIKGFANKRNEDALWKEWYRILQDYLLRDTPLVSNESAFLWIGLHATGWAAAALCFINPHVRHWPVYLLSSVFILFGALFPFLVTFSYLSSERLSYWDFTARLLAEVRATELRHIATEQISHSPSEPRKSVPEP